MLWCENHSHEKEEGCPGRGGGDQHTQGVLQDQGSVTGGGKEAVGEGGVSSRSLTWLDLWKSLHSFLTRVTYDALSWSRGAVLPLTCQYKLSTHSISKTVLPQENCSCRNRK